MRRGWDLLPGLEASSAKVDVAGDLVGDLLLLAGSGNGGEGGPDRSGGSNGGGGALLVVLGLVVLVEELDLTALDGGGFSSGLELHGLLGLRASTRLVVLGLELT